MPFPTNDQLKSRPLAEKVKAAQAVFEKARSSSLLKSPQIGKELEDYIRNSNILISRGVLSKINIKPLEEILPYNYRDNNEAFRDTNFTNFLRRNGANLDPPPPSRAGSFLSFSSPADFLDRKYFNIVNQLTARNSIIHEQNLAELRKYNIVGRSLVNIPQFKSGPDNSLLLDYFNFLNKYSYSGYKPNIITRNGQLFAEDPRPGKMHIFSSFTSTTGWYMNSLKNALEENKRIYQETLSQVSKTNYDLENLPASYSVLSDNLNKLEAEAARKAEADRAEAARRAAIAPKPVAAPPAAAAAARPAPPAAVVPAAAAAARPAMDVNALAEKRRASARMITRFSRILKTKLLKSGAPIGRYSPDVFAGILRSRGGS